MFCETFRDMIEASPFQADYNAAVMKNESWKEDFILRKREMIFQKGPIPEVVISYCLMQRVVQVGG